MALFRLIRLLPAVLFAAGAAAAAPLPVSQVPESKPRSTPLLDDHSGPNGYSDPFLWTCLGDLARGRIGEGEQACSTAIQFDPKDGDAYELRGYAYLIEHRFERAEADFQAALKLRPDNPEDLAGYGQSLSGLGRFNEAVIQFDKAVAQEPNDAAYRNALCWAVAGTGKNLDRALDECNRAIALAPGKAAPLNSRGLVELRMGRYQPAIADYTQSVAANVYQPSAYFGRGLARLATGQKEAGATDIRTARNGDADIDGMFVMLGVLNRECAAGVTAKCPAGFPKRTEEGKWMVAKWLVQ